MIVLRGLTGQSHLKDQEIVDHRQALQKVWEYRTASPETNEFINTMAWWQRMGALDQREFRKMVEGPFAGQDFKLVAMMTPQAAALLHFYHPEALKDREEFYRLLREHPEWQPGGA